MSDVEITAEELPVEIIAEDEPEQVPEPAAASENGENDKSDKPKSKRERKHSRSRSPRRSRSRSRSLSRSRSRSPRHDRSRKRFVNVNSTRVVVKNMPYELKWQDIKDLFRKEVGDVAYVEMIEGSDGKPRGMAVIEFKDRDAARKAIETMHQYKVHDRYLVVHEEREKDRRMFQQIGHRPGGGGGGGGGGSGGMDMRGGLGMGCGLGMGLGPSLAQNAIGGGISPEILAQLGIEGPISTTVFVANLDYKVTWHKLKEVFRLAGNVLKAEIKEDKNGKSRGMGIVQFEHPMEAVQAVSMFNGQTLFDRKMIVRMDKVPEEAPPAPKLPSGLKSIGMGLGVGGAPLLNIGQLNSVGGGLGLGGGLGSGGIGGGLGGLGMDVGLGGSGALGGGAGLGGLSGLGSAAGLGTGLGGGLGGTSGLAGLNSLGLGSGLGGFGGGGLGGVTKLPAGLGGLGDGLGLGLSGLGSNNAMMMGSGGGGGAGYGSGGGGGREERGGRVTRPDNCTVLVKNLPYSVTWQDLRERFQEIGEVKFAEIKMEKGRSSGQGLVRFSNEDDAMRAISNLDQTRFEGRTIEVRMYRG